MNEITINELLQKLEKNILNIIDIRSSYEYSFGKIPTAKNIEKHVLRLSPEKYLKKTETYYLYCNSGSSSLRLVTELNAQGYNTVNIIGGYNNYLLRK